MSNRPTRKQLDKKIDQFLAERRKSGGGYADVTEGDIAQLYDVVTTLVNMKSETDCDGDHAIEFGIYNRREHERLHYAPVPYAHNHDGAWATPEALVKHLNVVAMNHSIASDALMRALGMLKYDFDLVLKKKEK